MKHRNASLGLIGWGLMCVILPWKSALAYFDFVPTPSEWVSWPEYCRVQYSFIMQERDSEYANAYTSADFTRVQNELGMHTFQGIHHYCAGLQWYNRAMVQTQPNLRSFMLENALNETLFTYRWATHTSSVFPDIVISLARIRRARGETRQAMEALESAVRERPDSLKLYGGLALEYRDQGNLPKAKEVLLKADRLSGGKSAEIEYNLGLINLELGQSDEAARNAVRAYKLGYPLPGLKNKLRRIGKWPVASGDDVESIAEK